MAEKKRRKKVLIEQRVSTFLTKPELDFLDELSWQMKASGGHKLPRTKVIRAIISAVMNVTPDISGVRDEVELANKLCRTIRK